MHQADAVVQTVERLLSLCVELKAIGLDTVHGRLLEKDSIISHSASLHSLCLTNLLDTNASYPVEDLARIIRFCRELEDLGLPICPTDLGHIKDMGVGFTLHTAVSTFPRTEFEATLVSYEIEARNFRRTLCQLNLQETLAGLRNLRTLKLFNAPDVNFTLLADEGFPTGDPKIQCQILMQQFANQVLKVSPIIMYIVRSVRDAINQMLSMIDASLGSVWTSVCAVTSKLRINHAVRLVDSIST